MIKIGIVLLFGLVSIQWAANCLAVDVLYPVDRESFVRDLLIVNTSNPQTTAYTIELTWFSEVTGNGPNNPS